MPNDQVEKFENKGGENTHLDQIKNDIALLKKDAQALDVKVADFEKNKDKLNKDETDKLKKEIEDEAKRIEAKKQELLTLIRQTKGELDALKGTIGSTSEKDELEAMEKDLTSLTVKKGSFWDKLKEKGEKAWAWTKDQVVNHTGRTALIVGSAGLLYLWFRNRRKKKEAGESKKEGKKESFWNHGIGRALKWGAGIFGGILLWKNWSKVKGWFNDLFGEKEPGAGEGSDNKDALLSIEDAVKSFESIKEPKIKQQLNAFGENANTMYQDIQKFPDEDFNVGGEEVLGGGKDKYPGVIPHVMDNTYDNIGDMIDGGEKTFVKLCLTADINTLIEKFSTIIGTASGKLLGFVLGSIGFNGELTKETVSTKVKEFLSGTNKIEDMRMVFRKILKVMSYTTYMKNIYIAKQIEVSVKSGKTLTRIIDDKEESISWPDTEKGQRRLLRKIADNPRLYKLDGEYCENIEAQFGKQKLRDISSITISLQDLYAYDPDLQENIEDIHKDRKETLENLQKNPQETLENLKESAEDQMSESLFQGFCNYLPIAHLTEMIPGVNRNKYKEIIKDSAGFKDILAAFKKEFESLKTEKDTSKVKQKIDAYYRTLKEMRTTESGVMDMVEENGNRVWRAALIVPSTFVSTYSTISTGFTLIANDHEVKGSLYLAGGLYSTSILVSSVGRFFLPTTAIKVSDFIARSPFTLIGKLTGRYSASTIANIMPVFTMASYYNSSAKIGEGLSRNMSVSTAYRFYKKLSFGAKSSTEITKGFIHDVLKITDGDKISRIEKILFEDKKISSLGEKFIDEIINKPGFIRARKGFEIVGLDEMLVKYETTIQQLSKIKKIGIATENLGDIVSVTAQYKNLFKYGDNVDDLALKIIDQWNIADKANYFDDATQISKAKAYAKEIIDNKRFFVFESLGNSISTSWNKTKEIFKKGIDALRQSLKFSKDATAIREGNQILQDAEQQLQSNVSRVTDETIDQAQRNSKVFGKLEYLNTISSLGLENLNTLKITIQQDKTLLTALSRTKNVDEIKDILTSKGLNISEIPEEVFAKLAQTKNSTKMLDYLGYASEYQNMGILMKIWRNPLFKQCFNRGFAAFEAVMAVVQFMGDQKEIAEIAKLNKERAKIKQHQAYFNLAVGGGLSVAFATGLAMGWNPAGWVILGVAASIETVRFAGDKYYEVVNSYYRNIEDFKTMYVAQIKQEILSKSSWSESFDISFQEKFQEFIGWMSGGLHGTEKGERCIKTMDEAIRTLIYLEEIEKYPYAMVDINKYTQDEDKSFVDQVRKQKNSLDISCDARFEYIKRNYGNKPLSKQNLENLQGLSSLDTILLESRKYLTMKKSLLSKDIKDEDIKASDLLYQNESLKNIQIYTEDFEKKLKQNSNFTQIDALYKNNPAYFQTIINSIPYYTTYLSQHSDLPVSLLQQNIQYFVDYFEYKNFGKLASELINTADSESVDYDMLTLFFTDFSHITTGYTKENFQDATKNGLLSLISNTKLENESAISPILGQNILYRIAKEGLGGYKGSNTLDDLKMFFSPEQKERIGIYCEEGKWYINKSYTGGGVVVGWEDMPFATDAELNDPEKIKNMKSLIENISDTFWTKMIDTDTGTNESGINKEYGKKFISIIDEELKTRDVATVEKTKNDILQYIKDNSEGKYIQLSPDLLISGTRSGLENLGLFYYTFEGGRIKAITNDLSNPKCLLCSDVEYLSDSKELSKEVNAYVALVDASEQKLKELENMDGGDLDLYSNKDLVALLDRKYAEWNQFKTYLKSLNQEKALEKIEEKYTGFKMFFDDAYVMILNLATDGSSNDVDTYQDYTIINSYSGGGGLVQIENVPHSQQITFILPQIISEQYRQFFDDKKSTLKIPGKNKTLEELLNSSDKSDKQYALCAANIMLRSAIQSAMIDYGTSDVSNIYSRGIDSSYFEKYFQDNLNTITPQMLEMYQI